MNGPQTILLADDCENDRVFMRVAFKRAKCDILVQEVRNGEEVIAYLEGEGPYGDRNKFPLPIVLLLDLNMPKKNGFDVLAWVRSRPGLKRLTIIVLTASMRSEDVKRAFDLGVTSFLVKPSNLDALTDMIQCLSEWIRISHFPRLNADRPLS